MVLRVLVFGIAHEAEGMAAVAAVRGPLLHLLRVECGLRADDGGAGEAGGQAGDGVGAVGVGYVVMEGEPEAGAGAGAAAAGTDAGGVDVPLGGFAANELQGPSGVFQRPFDGGLDSGGVCLGHETIFDGYHGESGVEAFFQADDPFFGAAIPTAAVDEEHEWGGCFGGGFVEVDDLAGIAAVGDVGERGLDGGRGGFGRGFRFCRRLGIGGGWGLGGGGLGLARAEYEGKGEQGGGQAFHGQAQET